MNPLPVLALLALPAALLAAPAGPVKFNRDIRPILSDKCIFCHGPDAKHREGDLRLDVREAALEAKAFVPGKPEASELVQRILTHEEDDLMPPPESKKTLTPAEKDLLRRWIAEGATYEPHWAYVPVARPATAGSGPGAVDTLVAAGLATHGVSLSPEAGRRELLRRLSLDLTGLPPTPGELAAFLADRSADAYDKQVDRLLASPHFGERMAAWWLDVARFTDTVGYHGDQNQRIFPYRDYVIDAFNANKPFDRFTLEQLAGDLLPNPTPEQRVATGFNRLNMMTREGGAQPGEYLAKYSADRVRTVSQAFIGSTMGCAECHDHKYDPITARDFYSMAAFFADVRQWGVYADYGYTPNPDLRGYNNDYPFPPELEVESPALLRRMATLEKEMDALSATAFAAAKPEEPASWRETTLAFLNANPGGWSAPEPVLANPAGKDGRTNAVAQAQGVVRILNAGDKDEFVLELKPGRGWVAAVRLEALPHEKNGGRVVRGKAGGSTLSLSAAWRKSGQKKDQGLGFAFADSATKEPRYSHGMDLVGIRNGWKLKADRLDHAQESVWLLDRPVLLGDDDTLVVRVKPDQAGAVRVSTSPLSHGLAPDRPDAAALRSALAADDRSRTPAQKTLLARAWACGTGAGDWEALKRKQADWAECRHGRAHTMITEAWEPKVTRLLPRGNWQDESGPVLLPATPAFLPNAASAAKPPPAPPAPAAVEIVWMDDALPSGGDGIGDGPATFVGANPGPVFSGQKSLRRTATGRAQDVYLNGEKAYPLPDAPRLFAQVHLDPKNPPRAIMLQYNVNGSWDHRAVWGDPDAIEYGGKAGGPQKAHQGALPKAGAWVRLEIDASAVGLKAGDVVRGFAFTQFGGTVHWDKAGASGMGASPAAARQTRLDLARWITAPENPLTSRAVMNRVWKAFFGNGISAAVDDLGGQGEPPTHPELLDWLASEFRASGWDMKHMVRTLVRSATYRQASNLRAEMRERDPNNRLLSSQNPRRLEAEFVRDNALAIAGILNLDIGGPSAKPYQPAGYYSQLQFPDREYAASSDDRQWRRGVYMHWQRTFLHPMLANFDAPAREEATCTRNVSNTPQQALTLLNDPTFVEAARLLALRVTREAGSDDRARLERAFQLALARPVKPRESVSLLKLLADQRVAFKAAPEDARKLTAIGLKPTPEGTDPVELAAWTSVCRVVLNLHETITRY